jgi:hypothetical protein
VSISASREQRRQLARDSAKRPAVLTVVPVTEWPVNVPLGLVKVWRSREFLAQLYEEQGGYRRLSVSRTTVDHASQRWEQGITWDELQRLKREAGFGDVDAVEVYPRDCDVVNVANMRHLFLMNEPLPFAWRKR